MREMNSNEQSTFLARLSQNPRPALLWVLAGIIVFGLELGAAINFLIGLVPLEGVAESPLTKLPTLLSRNMIPNSGYQTPAGWQGTFLGLEPGLAWAIRVVLIYFYSFLVLLWLWAGYRVFRTHYRIADWTPRDDMIDRFRRHTWGKFGLVIVLAFLVMALFAPALGPTTLEGNIVNPYGNEIEYYDSETGSVATLTAGQANLESRSRGNPQQNIGPGEYDDHSRFHPFGTLPTGKDLFTFIAHGSRISLFIGLVAIGVSAFIATIVGLVTAYYRGLADLIAVVTGDAIMSIPRLMVVILLSFVAGKTWLAEMYSGGFLLALIFAGTGWPYLWRAIRGPAFQIANEEWIDAAKSYGQHPLIIMRKHMLPYVVGYLLVYASMTLGGIIVAVAGLSFLGLGVTAPTPEWGRAIDVGQQYVTTASWHISLIPGILIVLVVVGFNALGDGIRDAIDPESEGGAEEAATGGSGA